MENQNLKLLIETKESNHQYVKNFEYPVCVHLNFELIILKTLFI